MSLKNELRLGNWIHCSSLTDGSEFDVDCGLFHFNEMGTTVKYQYTPIELTTEWLQKFGFYENDNGNPEITIRKVGALSLSIQENKSKYTAWHVELLDSEYYVINESIEYVHQLQNLYFALSGRELTLNEDE